MRRALVFLLPLSCSACFSYTALCHDESCPPPADDTCDGVCVPYIGGGWSPVLVPATASTARATCPAAAPFEAMNTTSLTVCGVQPQGTCSSSAFACIPDEPTWRACVVRDGAQSCPSPYPLEVSVPGVDVTLCCPSDLPPA